MVYLLAKYLVRKAPKSKREEEKLAFEIVPYFEPNNFPSPEENVRINCSRKIIPFNSCNKDEAGAKFKIFGFDFRNIDAATNSGFDSYFRIFDSDRKLLYQSEICESDSNPDWITFVFNHNKVKYDWPFEFKFYQVMPMGEEDHQLGFFTIGYSKISYFVTENNKFSNVLAEQQSTN